MYRSVKRCLDVCGAVTLLIVTAPLMLLSALAIRITMGRPILFAQKRPGLNERIFTCYKLRTMILDERDSTGSPLTDEERTPWLGAWLRRTSLDELPQLWNILKGDLSFVGPRPLLDSYLPYYTPDEHRRHSVRPGLTGWAQVHGRNHLTFDERLALDVWYVDHLSFALDLWILIRTVWIVISQRGIAPQGEGASVPLDVQRGKKNRQVTAAPPR